MKKILIIVLALFVFGFTWADTSCIDPAVVSKAKNATKKFLEDAMPKKLQKYSTDFEKMAFVNKVISKADIKLQTFDQTWSWCYDRMYYLLSGIKQWILEYRNENLYFPYLKNNLSIVSWSISTIDNTWTVKIVSWTDEKNAVVNFSTGSYSHSLNIKFNFVDKQLYIEVQQDPIEKYLRTNISVYAPANEVLWGKFTVTNILWENTWTALISYEDWHVSYQNRFQVLSWNDTISAMPIIKLWEKFVLWSGKQIKYEWDTLYIKIISFVNSPCPEWAQCFWSGKWINIEFTKNWQTQAWLDLQEAMWYKLDLVDSDYTNYATFILNTITTWAVTGTWDVSTWSIVATGIVVNTWDISLWVEDPSATTYTWTLGTGTDYASIAQDKDSDITALLVRYIRKSIWKRTWDTSIMVSYNILGKVTTWDVTDYSIWAYCQEYKKSGDSLLSWAVVNSPISVKVAFTGDIYYAINYQAPMKWDNYTTDVQNIFPIAISSKILNISQSDYDKMIIDFVSRTYVAAQKFFGM